MGKTEKKISNWRLISFLIAQTFRLVNKENIDDVFINITRVYKPSHFNAVYNILLLAQENPEDHHSYIRSLFHLLSPTHVIIKKWIHDNIVF